MSKIDVAYHQSSCFGRICTDNNSSGVYYHNREDEKNKSNHHLDAVLAQAMKHLSFDELQREQEELHGVAVGISEEDEAVEGLLMALENHLNRLKQGTKFETAQLMDSVYVSRKEFRLMFLRGNRYDPKAAAEQLIRHFDTKSQLFGLNKLTKDITLADLDADDIHSLKTGSFQVSKWTDRSSRTIILELPGLRSYKSLVNELRARFYLLMNMATYMEDPTKGICFISYCVDQYKDAYNGSGFVEHTKMGLSIPCNIGGMHLCISDHTEAIITKAAIAIMPARLRAKTKVHFGSHTECQYQLSTFGISRVALPFSFEDNDICLDDHMTWYHQRLRSESNRDPVNSLSDSSSLEPTDNDVVFNGRTSNNQANERLRMLTLDYATAYDSNNVEDKRRIVTSMIEDIQSNGGRFLKFSNETEEWNEVPLVEVREKVCQMFRNLRRRAAQQQKPEAPMQIVTDISPNDVLFGRRKEHAGNLRLRLLIESLAAEYDAASRSRKKTLTVMVIQEIEQNGGRFLDKVDNDSWMELSKQALLDKLSSQFRNYRRRQKEKGLVK